MKRQLAIFLTVLSLGAATMFAQASGSVKGVCKDVHGNPIVDGVVIYQNQDNGQKYTLKTDKKGEYFSLGLAPGLYIATLFQNADDAKANKELFHIKNQVQLSENTVDFDLKKQMEDQAKGAGLSPEDQKKIQAQQEQKQKENLTVKGLNDRLLAARAASDAGDFDKAISLLEEANQVDATRDLIWFNLGDAYRNSGLKQTDPAERQKRLDSAVDAYKKALDLKNAVTDDKDPNRPKHLASYYNNLGEAYGKHRPPMIDEAVASYEHAAQIDPSGAAGYYYNSGAVLTNAGQADKAIVSFDKAIAADPNNANAYYQKGVNLLGKATLQGDKMVAPPGTAEAFQKYLELQPTGQLADAAKQMLASIGAPVETTFGTKKKPAKK
jgi:tetratricopeptide (TPR) repeat protein